MSPPCFYVLKKGASIMMANRFIMRNVFVYSVLMMNNRLQFGEKCYII